MGLDTLRRRVASKHIPDMELVLEEDEELLVRFSSLLAIISRYLKT